MACVPRARYHPSTRGFSLRPTRTHTHGPTTSRCHLHPGSEQGHWAEQCGSQQGSPSAAGLLLLPCAGTSNGLVEVRMSRQQSDQAVEPAESHLSTPQVTDRK